MLAADGLDFARVHHGGDDGVDGQACVIGDAVLLCQGFDLALTEDGVLLGLALHRPEDPDAEYVTLPDGVEMIIPGFFEQMPNIKRVRIPKSVRTLSMQCFAGVHRDFVIECEPGSYAEGFALEYGFQYDNGEKKAIGWQIGDPEEKVKWVVANYIREDMTEREKARAMHNWIITNSHYLSDGDSPESRESNMLLSEGFLQTFNLYHS